MPDQLRYRPLKALKAAILLLMGGFMLLYGVLLYFEFVNLSYILQIKNGVQFPESELQASDQRVVTTALVLRGLYFVIVVVFACVIYRLRTNVEALGARDLPISRGWTVGWFFVPIANLFMPFKAVRDVWNASVPVTGPWIENSASALVPCWWFLWIASNISNNIVSTIAKFAVTLEEIQRNIVLAICVSILDITLAAAASWMLLRLMQMQDEKFLRYGEQSGMRFTCAGCGETIPHQAGTKRCPLCGQTLITDFMSETESQQDANAAPPGVS